MQWRDDVRWASCCVCTRAVAILVAVGALNGSAPPLRAQTEAAPVEIVSASFSENIASYLGKNGGWLPLYVEVRARGDTDEAVTLEAIVSHGTDSKRLAVDLTARTRFDVPRGSAPRRAWLYVRVQPAELTVHSIRFQYTVRGKTYPLSMLGTGGVVQVHQDMDGVLPTWVVGGERDEVSPWASELDLNPARPGSNTITHDAVERIEAKQLPDRALGYHSVSMVVLRGIDESRLEPSQRDALLQWVALGGFVVLAPTGRDAGLLEGDLARALLGSALGPIRRQESFQPRYLYAIGPSTYRGRLDADAVRIIEAIVDQEDVAFGDRTALTRFNPLRRDANLLRQLRSAPVPRFELDPKSADPLPGELLYAEVAYGRGRVGVLTFDDQGVGFSGKLGVFRKALWRFAVETGRVNNSTAWREYSAQVVRSGGLGKALEEKREVGTFFIGGLIVAYLLVVGPGVYFFLKRRNRLPSIIWVEPVVILVYLGVIFVVGYVTKGILTKARQVTLLHQRQGEPFALRESYLSLFSADDVDYQIQCPRGELLLPIYANEAERQRQKSGVHLSRAQGSTVASQRDDALTLRGFHLDLWQQGVFLNSGFESFAGGDGVTDGVEIDVIDGGRRVQVTNRLPWAIVAGRVRPFEGGKISAAQWIAVPSIESGATVSIDVLAAAVSPADDRDRSASASPEDPADVDPFVAASRRARELAAKGLVGYRGQTIFEAFLDRGNAQDFRLDQRSTGERLDYYFLSPPLGAP